MSLRYTSLKSLLASWHLPEKLQNLPKSLQGFSFKKEPIPFEPAWGDLKPAFFQGPEKWHWNTPELYPYYRLVFYSTFAGLLFLTYLLFSLFQGASTKEAFAFERLVASLGAAPAEFQQESERFLQRFPQGKYTAQVQHLRTQYQSLPILKQLNQAEQQPTLPLRVEAYQVLLKQGGVEGALQKKIQDRLQRYSQMVQTYETQLARARRYSQKEYYSASLAILAQLVKQGPQYGTFYQEAQDLLNRISVKKIDYYIVKGQLAKARMALAEAYYLGVSPAVLEELTKKIKGIEQLKPLR